MHVLLTPMGSAGDVHPLIGLGRALLDRGHRATLLANDHFRGLAAAVGLEFVPLGDEAEFRHILDDPDVWHPVRCFRPIGEGVTAVLERMYAAIVERYVPGETVVAAGILAFAARVAQEKLGIPTATVHLQPGVFRSLEAPPVMAGMDLAGWPKGLVRLLLWFGDMAIVGPAFETGLNAFRARLGLPPVRRLLKEWVHSPQRVLGLFPAWFGPPQPDWPPQTLLTGFPLFDGASVEQLAPAVAAFLDAGEPPLVFTAGSANRHAEDFFREAVAACERLGRRGALLTRYPEHIPPALPESVRHFAYVPFSQILPRSAALVHHGGIGTTAQAFAAGVPQLIVPLAHDQFDNAARVERLGVGAAIARKDLGADAVAERLAGLLGSAEVAARCRETAARVAADRPFEAATKALEDLLDGPAPARAGTKAAGFDRSAG